jgi:hypothetical protein
MEKYLVSGNKPNAKIGERTAFDWQNEITSKIEPEHWPKICSLIYWRLAENDNSAMIADEWFRDTMKNYDYTAEYSNKAIQVQLDRLGVTIEYGRIETGVNSNRAYSDNNRRLKEKREAIA